MMEKAYSMDAKFSQSQVTEVTYDTVNSQPMTVWEFVINFRTLILFKYQYGKGI